MAVDVMTSIVIDRPRGEVAAFAADPGAAPRWWPNSEPAGFGKIAAPVMAAAIRRANQKDLARLKRLMEDPRPRTW